MNIKIYSWQYGYLLTRRMIRAPVHICTLYGSWLKKNSELMIAVLSAFRWKIKKWKYNEITSLTRVYSNDSYTCTTTTHVCWRFVLDEKNLKNKNIRTDEVMTSMYVHVDCWALKMFYIFWLKYFHNFPHKIFET